MRNSILLSLVYLGMVFGCGGNSDDQPVPTGTKTLPDTQFRSPDGRFTIVMPGQPIQELKRFGQGEAQLIQHKFSVFRNNKRELFMVYYMDIPEPAVKGLGTEKLIDSFVQDVAVSANGTLVDKRKIVINGHPGAEVKVKVPNTGIITARVFLVGNRCYHVSAAMPSAKASSEEVRKFLDSFQLFK
jgi:hypothetical protein